MKTYREILDEMTVAGVVGAYSPPLMGKISKRFKMSRKEMEKARRDLCLENEGDKGGA